MEVGEEWIVDAFGCEPHLLRDASCLQSIVKSILRDTSLHSLHEGYWHTFAGEGGVTGLVALQESHLAVHTYPEYRIATFSLYCCRIGCGWSWDEKLKKALGATAVTIVRVERGRLPATTSSNGMPTKMEHSREG